MAFRFLHRKNRNAAKRFGKKGWSLRRGKRTFPKKGFFPSSSNNLYWEQSFEFLSALVFTAVKPGQAFAALTASVFFCLTKQILLNAVIFYVL
jgi:hypothetical protein